MFGREHRKEIFMEKQLLIELCKIIADKLWIKGLISNEELVRMKANIELSANKEN